MKYFIITLLLSLFCFTVYGQGDGCDAKLVMLTEDGLCNSNPYVLVFEDNFDGNTLDLTNWELQTAHQGSFVEGADYQYFSLENNEVSNGILKIVAKRDPGLRKAVSWMGSLDTVEDGFQNLRQYEYTSSCIWTKRKFSYGKFEIRCKLPKGKGFFPAFWTYGNSGIGQYDWNEIDVFEFWNENNAFGNYDPSRLSKFHKMNAYSDFNDEGVYNCSVKYEGVDFSADFHTFSVTWTPYKLIWEVDGEVVRSSYTYHTLSGQDVDCNSLQAWQPYLRNKWIPKHPMNIIANLSVQQGENAPDEETTFPSALEIDFIKYYKQLPCSNEVEILSLQDLNLSPNLFNVIVGSDILISGDLTINSGEQLAVIASNQIVIESGFLAQEGSSFIARIDESACLMAEGKWDSNDTNNIISNFSSNSRELSVDTAYTDSETFALIYPNPTSGWVTIKLYDFDPNKYSLYAVNSVGQVIFDKNKVDEEIVNLNFIEFSSALYFLYIYNKETSKSQQYKIFKQ
jgi:beta-glucanase (GH16 family)